MSVAGGGGGAGYVYIGAWMRLFEAGLVPAYVIGASIGAVIGLFPARSTSPDWEAYIELARTLKVAKLFSPPTRERRYGLTGLAQLRLGSTFGAPSTPLLATPGPTRPSHVLSISGA